AGLELVALPSGLERAAECRFGPIQELVTADAGRRTGSELERRLQSEGLVIAQNEVHEELHLVHDLPVGEKDVAVVLGELADASESGERSGHLVSMQHIKGDVAERELPVGMLLRRIEQVMGWAVHRLER